MVVLLLSIVLLVQQDALAHLRKGLELVRSFDYGGAASEFEKAVAIDRELAAAYRQLVLVYSQLGKRESARKAYRRASAIEAIPQGETIPVARALRKAGLLSEGRAVLAAGVPTEHAYFELGLLDMEEGSYARAREHLALAAERVGTADAHYEYGRSLEALGELSPAVEAYRRALTVSPMHRHARFRLGTLLLRSGNVEEGERLLRDYEAFRKWDREVKLLLAMLSSGALAPEERKSTTRRVVDLLLEGNGLAEVERLLAPYDSDPSFELERARWFLASGRLDEARRSVDKVRDSSPETIWLSAKIQLRLGNVSAALSEYQIAVIRFASPPAGLYQEMATAYAMDSRLSDAVVFFEKAISLDPKLASAHADLGLALETMARIDEAEVQYRKALAIDPELLSALQGLGSLLLARGDPEAALALFQKSVALYPDDPLLHRNVQLALERLGRHEP